jgi:phage tail-like protein
MAEFVTNPERRDPYKNFKFRVRWDGLYVAGVSKVSGLSHSTEVVTHREGGDFSLEGKSPGRTTFEPIRLERGVTHDRSFEDWAGKVWKSGPSNGLEMSLKDFRKNVRIELFNEAGQLVIAWQVYRCWPSAYTALAELDANAGAVAIESLVLENEGWERDADVVEPVEPTIG